MFAITPDGDVRHRWWNGTEWVPWQPVAGAPAGARAVSCAWVGDRLDVFVRGADDQVWYGRLG